METQLKAPARNWFAELIMGIIFIVMGIWVICTPVESYLALSILFAVMFLATGIMEIGFSLASRKQLEGWGWSLTGGIIDTLVGLLLIVNLPATVVVLSYYVGFVVLFRSALAIGLSIELNRLHVRNWGMMLVSGILGVIFGFILLWNPLFAGLTIVFYSAVALFSLGIFEIALSFSLKKTNREFKRFQQLV